MASKFDPKTMDAELFDDEAEPVKFDEKTMDVGLFEEEAPAPKVDKTQSDKYGEVTRAEAVARGVAQSIPLVDELAGATEGSLLGGLKSAGQYLGVYEPKPGDADVAKYEAERDLQRARDAAAAEKFPADYYTANIGGSVVMPAAVAAKGLSTAGKIGVGAAEGAAYGLSASEGDKIAEDAGNIALGAGIGAAPGAIEAGRKATQATAKMAAGPRGAKFVGNPELMEQAENASILNREMLAQNKVLAEEGAVNLEKALGVQRQLTNAKYAELDNVLKTLDQVELDPNSSAARRAYDKLNAALFDPEITPIDKVKIKDVMERTFINRPVEKVVEQGTEFIQKPSGELEPTTMPYTPDSTVGENLAAADRLRRNLSDKAFANKNPIQDTIQATSSQKMKNLAGDLRSTVEGAFEGVGPEIAQARTEAIGQAKKEIGARELIRRRLGDKIPGESNRQIQSNRIRTAMQAGGKDLRQRILGKASEIGADEELRAIDENMTKIQQNRALQNDLEVLKKPAGVLGSAVSKVPMVGPQLGNRAAAIDLYNNVRTFGKPALTAAVKFLERTGRPITAATIRELSEQHGVPEDELSAALGGGGQ